MGGGYIGVIQGLGSGIRIKGQVKGFPRLGGPFGGSQ